MTHNPRTIQLTLLTDIGEEGDIEELDQLTRQLLAELREFDLEYVSLVREGDSPEGAKAVEAISVGALGVAVLPVILPKLVEFLQAWSLRRENRTVKIKTQVGDRSLEVEYLPETMTQDELINLVDKLTGRLTKNDKTIELD
jgi:hypothetical protein